MDYVELHSRSAFSFLRGASLPEQLVERAGQLQMPALGLCDRDGVYGAPRLFARAKAAGVRPIVGAELTMEDKTILPVLVASHRGYQNLCQLLTRAHLRSEKGKAHVLWSELPEFTEGLIALTGDQEGVLGDAVLFDRPASSPRNLTPDNSPSPRPSPQGEGDRREPVGESRALQMFEGRSVSLPLPGERAGVRGNGRTPMLKATEIIEKLRRIFGTNNIFI